jgi:hypothetical protein
MKKYILILLILALPTITLLFQKGYFPIHDDLQVMRQLQMDKCFKDGQIPCRWINDMGYGYGFPLFIFYPPLPYLIGQPIHTLGFSFIDTVKIVGIIGFLSAAFSMYWLAREFWGENGGVVAAIVYLYAPYRAVNFYVRAAVNEFWASVFFPMVLLAIYKIINKKDVRWGILLSISIAGLVLSHNQMLMIFSPVIAAWAIYWWWRTKSLVTIWQLICWGVFGIGLSAFYLFPVLLENKFAHLETLVVGYFNYLAHYLDLNQIFLRINWGYGSSELGTNDGMSFALGYAQWLIPVMVITSLVFLSRMRRHLSLVVLFVGLLLWSLFMTHSKSTPLWQMIRPLEYLQFPWRFMTLAMFLAAFVSGALAKINTKWLITLTIAFTILSNGNYFQPREWQSNATDESKFSGRSWYLLTTNGIFDYLPIGAAQPPAGPPPGNLSIIEGKGQLLSEQKNTHLQRYQIQAETPLIAQVETYYFPGWIAWIDGKMVRVDSSRDPVLGRMRVDMPAGTHDLILRFTDTPVRQVSDTVSLVAWAGMVGIIILWRKKSLSGM